MVTMINKNSICVSFPICLLNHYNHEGAFSPPKELYQLVTKYSNLYFYAFL